ncbi:cytochrome c oxidase assembly protein COX18, mitochondrial [Drosophila kikkawai]|uniref:Mitochondrial inner membrane protein COX18 n=1 Tax=Drosophila kikkawai TaxID=30033 RepID=A0A6P4IYI2_DROKI|nr:cytochrome c oxidase assembly protein COX18, mitochondrial [Drosophila kikkawai]XP_017028299.1 cytochrome c oxidase assembly protein COX18, mitochondrial [Drosophila kikkawai]
MAALLLYRACRRPILAGTYKNSYPGATFLNDTSNHRPASTEAAVTAATSVQVANASGMVGFWQTLSNSTPVAYMQDALIQIHDYSGLPWWASIVLSTFLFRSVVTLPLTVYQHRITARIERIALEMPAIVEELKREAAMAKHKFKWTDKQTQVVYQRSIKKQWQKLIIRDNCHPMKTLIVLWGQVPLWIFQSVALRNLVYLLPDPTSIQAQIVATEMTIGGFGWIPNLTVVDSSYILPVALGLINLAIIEVQSMSRTRPATRLQNAMNYVFRGLSVVMVPVACTVPSALCVYWVASSSFGLAQNLLLLSPEVRRSVGIPKTQTELDQPYDLLWLKIQQRVGLVERSSPADKTQPPATK